MLLEKLLELLRCELGVNASRDPEKRKGIVLRRTVTGAALVMAVVRATARVICGGPVPGLGLGGLAGQIGVEDERARTALCGGPPSDVT